MPHLAQHSAAELWELSRDHYLGAAKLEMVLPQVQDQQLKTTLTKHAQEFRQIAQRLDQFLGVHQSPAGGSFGGSFGSPSFGTATPPTGTGFGIGTGVTGVTGTVGGTFGTNAGWGQGHPGAMTSSIGTATAYSPVHQQPVTGAHPIDVILVGDCLKQCKSMAVQCVHAATELSQPARNYVYEIAGLHLRLAEEHYNWLKQRQLYASPKVNPQDIQEYARALQSIASIDQQVAANSRSMATPYGMGGGPAQFTSSIAQGQPGAPHRQYQQHGHQQQHSQHQQHGLHQHRQHQQHGQH